MKRTRALVAVAVGLALTVAGCSSSSKKSGGSGSTVVVGSADFTENILLADIYADALSAKGIKVSKHLNIGERPIYVKALTDGSIDFIPEYSGSILPYLDSTATAKTPGDVYTALQAVAAKKNFAVLNYAPAQDSDTITVTAATASQYHLTSIGDLAAVAGKMTLGAPAGFQTRPDGVPSLKSVYGVTFGKFTPLAAGTAITVAALKNGTIQAGDIFSTDGSIKANNFVSLTDTKSMFAAQNIIPVLRKSSVTPAVTAAANAVSAKLDTATLATLDTQASATGADVDAIAKAWLKSVGLG